MATVSVPPPWDPQPWATKTHLEEIPHGCVQSTQCETSARKARIQCEENAKKMRENWQTQSIRKNTPLLLGKYATFSLFGFLHFLAFPTFLSHWALKRVFSIINSHQNRFFSHSPLRNQHKLVERKLEIQLKMQRPFFLAIYISTISLQKSGHTHFVCFRDIQPATPPKIWYNLWHLSIFPQVLVLVMKFLKKKIDAHIFKFDILVVWPYENVIHVTGLTWGFTKQPASPMYFGCDCPENFLRVQSALTYFTPNPMGYFLMRPQGAVVKRNMFLVKKKAKTITAPLPF